MKPAVRTLFGELSDVATVDRERYYATHDVAEDTRREVESLLAFDSGTSLEEIVQTAVVVFISPAS
jgi:hypothetical protein